PTVARTHSGPAVGGAATSIGVPVGVGGRGVGLGGSGVSVRVGVSVEVEVSVGVGVPVGEGAIGDEVALAKALTPALAGVDAAVEGGDAAQPGTTESSNAARIETKRKVGVWPALITFKL
ncbi:MAG: hypothetical protein ACRDIY_05290, partial [Chloroflexota bacterium]